MTLSEQFLLGLQAYREIKQEIHPGPADNPLFPEQSSFARLVAQMGPLPESSLLMGMALDGLPLLLDLHDPHPGPIIVTGDGHCGKTAFLQFLARSSELFSNPGDVQFAAITHFPEEWTGLEALPNSMGIWPAYHRSGRKFLSRLVIDGENPTPGRQVILLLLDGLELMVNISLEFQSILHWLFRNGPAWHVWPIVTINSRRMDQYPSWMQDFRTWIIGHVENADQVHSWFGDYNLDLSSLKPGNQFYLWQSEYNLKFWIPLD